MIKKPMESIRMNWIPFITITWFVLLTGAIIAMSVYFHKKLGTSGGVTINEFTSTVDGLVSKTNPPELVMTTSTDVVIQNGDSAQIYFPTTVSTNSLFQINSTPTSNVVTVGASGHYLISFVVGPFIFTPSSVPAGNDFQFSFLVIWAILQGTKLLANSQYTFLGGFGDTGPDAVVLSGFSDNAFVYIPDPTAGPLNITFAYFNAAVAVTTGGPPSITITAGNPKLTITYH